MMTMYHKFWEGFQRVLFWFMCLCLALTDTFPPARKEITEQTANTAVLFHARNKHQDSGTGWQPAYTTSGAKLSRQPLLVQTRLLVSLVKTEPLCFFPIKKKGEGMGRESSLWVLM